jgi:thiamine-monophosphate kinase
MELEFVRWLCQRLPADARMLVGPGDDAAILRFAADANVVATTDMLMEGVDFELARHGPARIGRKALAANLSDLAAMAAVPVAALVSLCLPTKGGEALAKQLIEGILPLAAEMNCPIAGGDTNSWEGPLVISVTALGEVPQERRWRRSGARPGDAILVTDEFGGSILRKQFDFKPRVREALWLAENAAVHAAIDVSDGLSLDLARICEASGCGAAVDLSRVPIADAAVQLAGKIGNGTTGLEHALGDGEDFELILAVPTEDAERIVAEQPLDVPLTRIGTFVEGAGLFSVGDDGKRKPLTPRGFEHRLEV